MWCVFTQSLGLQLVETGMIKFVHTTMNSLQLSALQRNYSYALIHDSNQYTLFKTW